MCREKARIIWLGRISPPCLWFSDRSDRDVAGLKIVHAALVTASSDSLKRDHWMNRYCTKDCAIWNRKNEGVPLLSGKS